MHFWLSVDIFHQRKKQSQYKLILETLIKKTSLKRSMKDLRKYSKYFLLAFFVFIFYFSFKIIQPFIITILGAVILAYIFSPMFHFLQKRIKNKTLTAIIVVSLTIVILVLPLIFTITLLQKEAANINQDQLKTALTVFLKDYFGAKTEEYIV